jgi:hypothetical protein
MAALDTRQRFQLSYWDSVIIEASRAMGCTEVLSEVLGDGQDYAGIQHHRRVARSRCPGTDLSQPARFRSRSGTRGELQPSNATVRRSR